MLAALWRFLPRTSCARSPGTTSPARRSDTLRSASMSMPGTTRALKFTSGCRSCGPRPRCASRSNRWCRGAALCLPVRASESRTSTSSFSALCIARLRWWKSGLERKCRSAPWSSIRTASISGRTTRVGRAFATCPSWSTSSWCSRRARTRARTTSRSSPAASGSTYGACVQET